MRIFRIDLKEKTVRGEDADRRSVRERASGRSHYETASRVLANVPGTK
jgi:hypothetical protein